METSALSFSQPAWFFGLAIVPVVAALYFWSQKRSGALIAKVVAPRLQAQLARAVSVGRRAFKSVLILAVFALIALALAQPQMGFTQREVKQRGRDVIIAVDTSRSMLATDVTPTRLARAKLVAQDLLRLVRGDRIGLVAFAGSAFLQAPLTLDYHAVITALGELDTTVIPKGGTNIAAAIRAAEEAFGKGEGQSRALIILTDGEELDADGIAAAKKASSQGVRIFTVGIGSGEGSLIPLQNVGGGADFVRDSSGKPVQSRLDETRLKEIAEAGGGFYEPLSADGARSIFEKGILPMETAERGTLTARQPVEQYQWPVGAAIALLALWLILGDRKRAPKVARRAAVALLLISASVSQGATGIEEYQAGAYDKARTDFEKRLQTAPDSRKLQFNAGAAAYQLKDYGKAVDYFTNALLAEDRKLHESASYNLGNALVRRGESVQAKEEKKADWKNAIQHYTEALTIDAKNKLAEENREIVKKMLEDLEKEEKQQDQKDKKDQKQDKPKDQKDQDKKQDQNQPEQNQKDQQKDQEKNDQKKGQSDQSGLDKKDQEKQPDGEKDGEKKDQPKPDEKKGGEKKDEQKSEPQGGDGNKDQSPQDMAKNDSPQAGDKQPAPQPTPGEKKQGDLKPGQNEAPKPGEENEGAPQEAGTAEKEGEMSPAQARNLLNSLRSEEGHVQLMQSQETQDTLKDW